ncbi:hypothetical protein DER45DRAFT_59879 [Fusarium avenaceum]|nr:hypothetical protein DER45DRAFT_59879 [Fusarium avenaceum]
MITRGQSYPAWNLISLSGVTSSIFLMLLGRITYASLFCLELTWYESRPHVLFNGSSLRDKLHANSVLLGLGLAQQYLHPSSYAARHRVMFHRSTGNYAHGTIHTSNCSLNCLSEVVSGAH